MSYAEKQELTELLGELPEDKQARVVQIVAERHAEGLLPVDAPQEKHRRRAVAVVGRDARQTRAAVAPADEIFILKKLTRMHGKHMVRIAMESESKTAMCQSALLSPVDKEPGRAAVRAGKLALATGS